MTLKRDKNLKEDLLLSLIEKREKERETITHIIKEDYLSHRYLLKKYDLYSVYRTHNRV